MKVTLSKSTQKLSQSTQVQFYQKPTIQISPFSKIKQSFHQLSTNMYYYANTKLVGGAKNFIQLSNDKDIIILGEGYHQQKQAQKKIQTFIWFSYRKIPGLTKQYNTDNGWGCLIRVGQMALATGLKIFLEFKYKNDKKYDIRQQIINAFLESGNPQQKYSLNKIVKQGTKLFQLNYGNWFTSNQICQVLTSLHIKNPMKGTQMLSLINFDGNYLSIYDMLEKMNKTICQCYNKKIICNICNKNNINQSITKIQNSEQKLLVFVNCRLGCSPINQQTFQQVKQLLNLKSSGGIIGGIPKRGLYFIGHEKMQLICLDPHLVQDQVKPKNLQKMIQTFTCKDFNKCKYNKIDPSLAFVFYLDNLQTMKQLENKITEFQLKYENPIISISWEKQPKRKEKLEEEDMRPRNLRNSFVGTI